MSDSSHGEKTHEKTLGKEALERERYELLQRLEDQLDTPMLRACPYGAGPFRQRRRYVRL
jgi:hypothetical protein